MAIQNEFAVDAGAELLGRGRHELIRNDLGSVVLLVAFLVPPLANSRVLEVFLVAVVPCEDFLIFALFLHD